MNDTYFLIGHGLNLYKVLAPNAYPQLNDHVEITDSRVLSQVYDVSHSVGAWGGDYIIIIIP